MIPESPLSSESTPRRLLSVSRCEIAEGWKRSFGIKLGAGWDSNEKVELWECPRTKLRFFCPKDAAAGKEIYAQLQQCQWYYMQNKWEYRQALALLAGKAKQVLEVGCGTGAFISKLIKSGQRPTGIDMNSDAVSEAKRNGLPVEQVDLEIFAESRQGSFDVVCHFQVLEHATDPLQFLSQCLRCLRPGGLLMLAIPNMESFIQYDDENLLNMPPHHMTQWFPETLHSLESVLHMRITHICFEPLASYHVHWYLNVRLRQLKLLQSARWLRAIVRFALYPFVCFPLIRRCIVGHTQFCCFQKL
jgi:2-polyprenyl-3-methyl-5-hydroxy-6-metoxy-1,4-benzoquinol methylase